METLALPDRSPASLKRPRPADLTEDNVSSTPSPLERNQAMNSLSRQGSPTPSSITTLTSLSATPPPPTFNQDGTAHTLTQPAPKRRKLTLAEREQQRIDREHKRLERAQLQAQREQDKMARDEEKRQKAELKEAKQREKEIEKERKDQEKAKKDEEKAKKDEEKAKKDEEKALEKAKKDEEKAKKDEEKAKKDRSQLRLTGFFPQPKPAPKIANIDQISPTPAPLAGGPAARRNSTDILEHANDYRKSFLPFALPAHTKCAPNNLNTWDDNACQHIGKIVEQCFLEDHTLNTISLQASFSPLFIAQKRHPRPVPVKTLILRITEAGERPVGVPLQENPLEMLKNVSMRHLTFHEDVRPPYIGTCTKLHTRRLFRNPFARLRLDTDYDYDSEAEWEEPEEGEDIDIDDDSDGEALSEMDDMDGFLDDEDDGQPIRKKLLAADLEPVSTGLCLEDIAGLSLDESGVQMDFRAYRLETLLEALTFPIDPFSNAYWPTPQTQTPNAQEKSSTDTMHPPSRPPLQSKPNGILNGTIFGSLGKVKVNDKPQTEKAPKAEKINGSVRLLAGEELETFKRAINGSDDNKVFFLGLMKKQFPKVPNSVLKDTLEAVAVKRKGEKTWSLL